MPDRSDTPADGDLDTAYAAHATAVYSSARWICGADAAEGVTLRVFVDAWRSGGTLDAREVVVRKRLVAAVLNHAETFDHPRPTSPSAGRRARRGRSRPDRSPRNRTVPPGADTAPWCDAGPLDRSDRAALALAVFGGCTCEEIARLVDESEHEVAIRLQRAMRTLEQSLATPSPEPPLPEPATHR